MVSISSRKNDAGWKYFDNSAADVPSLSSFSRPYATHGHDEGHPNATVLFSFEASSPFELSVTGMFKI